MSDGLNDYDILPNLINHPPVTDAQFKKSGHVGGKRFRGDGVEKSGKPGDFIEDAFSYRSVDLFKIV